MKNVIKKIPTAGAIVRRVYRALTKSKQQPQVFDGSREYWERRYVTGGDSGVGSYGKFAEFKAEVLNNFVATRGVQSIIEFGCGDGHQLTLAKYPTYIGFDVSETAVQLCRAMFTADPTKVFDVMDQYSGQKADLTLSLDVVYHLVEDHVFDEYMRRLFDASNRYVIIYSSDSDDNRGYAGSYMRHRKFSAWVQLNCPSWKVLDRIANRFPYRGDYRTGSFADFFIYQKV